ncbi:Choline/ethanolamine kinase [Halotydeus destructor]|nr:Choline/ethanolamine kinase [Halotydeus destructor]
MTSSSLASDDHLERAKMACSENLTGNWSRVDRIKTSPISGGFVNILVKCSLDAELCDEQSKPHHVAVRLYAEASRDKFNQRVGEALVLKAIAEAKLGPKFICLFNGGRIEEFIDGQTLPSAIIRNEANLRSLAGCLARLHSLTIDLPRGRKRECRLREFIASNLASRVSINLDDYSGETREALEYAVKYDILDECDWINERAKQIATRTVFSHNDCYPNNIMVRSGADLNNLTESDIVLVDLDTVGYSVRGFDFASLLNEAAFDVRDTKNPRILGHLAEELEMTFLDHYLSRWKELNPELYDPKVDNVSNLMLEQRLWSLHLTLLICSWLLQRLSAEKNSFNDNLIKFFCQRLKTQKERRAWIEEQFMLRNN